MSKIYIHEVDETTTGVNQLDTTDVVYIPGFSALTLGDYEGPGLPHVPTLCRTVTEFERYFGSYAPTFKEDQPYPAGFDSNSVPKDVGGTPKVMFKKDDPDPSYVYAKELLLKGFPVLYERINEAGELPSVQTMYSVLSNIFRVGQDVTDKVHTEGLTISVGSAASFYDTFLDTGLYKFIYHVGTNKDVTVSFSSALEGRLAPVYDSTSTYSLDDYCTYNGIVYKCVYAVTEPEEFNPSNWEIDNSFAPTSFFSINKDKFLEKVPFTTGEVTTTVFTAASGTSGIIWKIGDDEVNLAEYGISVSGTYNAADTITVTENPIGTWECDQWAGSSIPGVTVTGTPVEGNEVTLFLEVTDPVLLERGQYQFKYLTSGGYPTFEYNSNSIANDMARLCANRGDAVAFIDHTDNPSRPLSGTKSIYYILTYNNFLSTDIQPFATMFTPSFEYRVTTTYRGQSYSQNKRVILPSTVIMPASFAYFTCLATSVKTNPNWYAIAGTIRGRVTNVSQMRTDKPLTNALADAYSSDTSTAINPITNIVPYGECIWGNRTLLDNSIKQGTVATSFLNIRNMVSDVKKNVYSACQSLLFEQNTDVLWANFLFKVTPLLDSMVNGGGLSNYKIIKLPNSDRTRINVKIRLYPIYAVESFDVTIYLNDKGYYEDSEE